MSTKDLEDEYACLRLELHDALARIAQLEAGAADQLTVREAAEIVGRSDECVRQWCRAGRIGSRGRFGRWLIGRRELREFLVARHGADHLPPLLAA